MQGTTQSSSGPMLPSYLTLTHLGSRVGRIFATLRRSLAAARADRLAERQLAAMSDRELADIGLSRGNLQSAVIFPHRHSIDAFALHVLDREEALRHLRRARP